MGGPGLCLPSPPTDMCSCSDAIATRDPLTARGEQRGRGAGPGFDDRAELRIEEAHLAVRASDDEQPAVRIERDARPRRKRERVHELQTGKPPDQQPIFRLEAAHEPLLPDHRSRVQP